MPINGLNVGRDVRLTISSPSGIIAIPSTRIKSFSSMQKTYNRETAAIDGVTRHVNIPGGWSGNFEIEKVGDSIDAFFANLEVQYYNGANIGTYTIAQTIENPDISITTYQYIGTVFTFSSAGDWMADNYITQKVEFSSEKRLRLN